MNTEYKPMSAQMLIQCLAGELLCDAAILIETIRQEEDLRHLVRSYAHGDFTYEYLLDAVKDYI